MHYYAVHPVKSKEKDSARLSAGLEKFHCAAIAETIRPEFAKTMLNPVMLALLSQSKN